MSRIRDLACQLKAYLAVGLAERGNHPMYDSVVIFSPEGALTSRYSKSHPADDEPFNAKSVESPVVSTPFGRWGTLICFDRQLPEMARILSLIGAQLILIPALGRTR